MSIINQGFFGKQTSEDDERRKRIPPGQTEVVRWPVLTYGPTPHIDIATWTLTIDGAVNKPITLNWKQFNVMSKTKLVTDIHCVTRWSRLDMEWEGVSLDDLIEAAGGLTDKANFLIATSEGDYTTNLPVQDVVNGQAMVATHAHDEPLTDEHGGPARLFIPHLYLWKSAKWVRKLTFTPDDHPGFWENYGYHNHGDPWREERYDSD
jgi:DMSO/TMAO reductase YedYZ molybdopterin-dependent catalytic subunit